MGAGAVSYLVGDMELSLSLEAFLELRALDLASLLKRGSS